jgi:hypothetical protein
MRYFATLFPYFQSFKAFGFQQLPCYRRTTFKSFVFGSQAVNFFSLVFALLYTLQDFER